MRRRKLTIFLLCFSFVVGMSVSCKTHEQNEADAQLQALESKLCIENEMLPVLFSKPSIEFAARMQCDQQTVKFPGDHSIEDCVRRFTSMQSTMDFDMMMSRQFKFDSCTTDLIDVSCEDSIQIIATYTVEDGRNEGRFTQSTFFDILSPLRYRASITNKIREAFKIMDISRCWEIDRNYESSGYRTNNKIIVVQQSNEPQVLFIGYKYAAYDDTKIRLANRNADKDMKEVLGLSVNEEQETEPPIIQATQIGNLEKVKELIDNGEDVNTKDDDDWTALHYAANWSYVEIARYLLNHGADVNAETIWGWTPLHWAVRYDSLEMVELLIEYGADVSAININMMTPIDIAKARGKSGEHVVEYLKSLKAK